MVWVSRWLTKFLRPVGSPTVFGLLADPVATLVGILDFVCAFCAIAPSLPVSYFVASIFLCKVGIFEPFRGSKFSWSADPSETYEKVVSSHSHVANEPG